MWGILRRKFLRNYNIIRTLIIGIAGSEIIIVIVLLEDPSSLSIILIDIVSP